MSVFRVEKNKGYMVMSNHHLRNHTLSLKAKGLLSQMLSLPEDWDYTLQGLAQINKESIDAIREAVRELERAGYIERSRERDERGCLRGTVYTIYEQSHMDSAPGQPGHGNIMRSHVRIRPAHSEGAAGTWRPSMRQAKHKRRVLPVPRRTVLYRHRTQTW